MHNKRLQLARASHWHIVINVLPVRRISQRRLGLIWVWDGWGCRSDPGIIVGDSDPYQSAGWDMAQVSRGR